MHNSSKPYKRNKTMTKEEIIKRVRKISRRYWMYKRLWIDIIELIEQDEQEKAITKLSTLHSVSVCGGNPDIMQDIGQLLQDLRIYKALRNIDEINKEFREMVHRGRKK